MAVDFFLQLDGIKGEANDQGVVDWMKLQSWGMSASQVSSVSGSGGSGAGKVSLSEVNIAKDFDMASPKLFEALLKGKHIPKATLVARKAGGEPFVFLQADFTEVFITAVAASGSSEIPQERVSFSYSSIAVEYKMQLADGAVTTVSALQYDVTANKVG